MGGLFAVLNDMDDDCAEVITELLAVIVTVYVVATVKPVIVYEDAVPEPVATTPFI